MSEDTVAKVDAPGKLGGDAVSAIAQSRQKTANPSDRGSRQQGIDEGISRRLRQSDAVLGHFYTD